MSVRVFAPAKINLTLKVGRTRADGLHPLQSVVAFADVGDVVAAEDDAGLSLAIESELFADQLVGDDDNLVLRAVRALAAASGVEARGRLTLEKNLPVASGIGGGSSDAAAALKALNQLWGLNWSNAQLAELGLGLGADVPVFFSSGSAAFMSGAGEACAPMALPALPAVLVNPLMPLATAEVYRQFDSMGLGSALGPSAPPHWADAQAAIAAMAALGNDLDAPARALMPQIGEIISELRPAPTVRYAALSGSGASVFALMRDWEAAESFADLLRERHRDWWVVETMLGA